MKKVDIWKNAHPDSSGWAFEHNYSLFTEDGLKTLSQFEVNQILRHHFNTLKLAKEIPEILRMMTELNVMIKMYTIDEKYVQRN